MSRQEPIRFEQPPPATWRLTIELYAYGNPRKLREAQFIIHSYLDEAQRQRKRLKKGVHEYELSSIDHVIDFSIRDTVTNELAGHAKVFVA